MVPFWDLGMVFTLYGVMRWFGAEGETKIRWSRALGDFTGVRWEWTGVASLDD